MDLRIQQSAHLVKFVEDNHGFSCLKSAEKPKIDQVNNLAVFSMQKMVCTLEKNNNLLFVVRLHVKRDKTKKGTDKVVTGSTKTPNNYIRGFMSLHIGQCTR